jgi:hypothetical protein
MGNPVPVSIWIFDLNTADECVMDMSVSLSVGYRLHSAFEILLKEGDNRIIG